MGTRWGPGVGHTTSPLRRRPSRETDARSAATRCDRLARVRPAVRVLNPKIGLGDQRRALNSQANCSPETPGAHPVGGATGGVGGRPRVTGSGLLGFWLRVWGSSGWLPGVCLWFCPFVRVLPSPLPSLPALFEPQVRGLVESGLAMPASRPRSFTSGLTTRDSYTLSAQLSGWPMSSGSRSALSSLGCHSSSSTSTSPCAAISSEGRSDRRPRSNHRRRPGRIRSHSWMHRRRDR